MSGRKRSPLSWPEPEYWELRGRGDDAMRPTKKTKGTNENKANDEASVTKECNSRRLRRDCATSHRVHQATRIQAAFRGWRARRALVSKRCMAARRIQRWIRKQWSEVWSWTRACVVREWRARDHVHFVEPCGSRYVFHARALASLFLASADFRHPVTRRVLTFPEFRRVTRASEPEVRTCMEMTWRHASEARQALFERDSLLDFMSSEAGRKLDLALELAENAEEQLSFRLALNAYEDAVHDLHARMPTQTLAALEQHEGLIARRLHLCTMDAACELLKAFRTLTLMAEGERQGVPQAAVVVWMESVIGPVNEQCVL